MRIYPIIKTTRGDWAIDSPDRNGFVRRGFTTQRAAVNWLRARERARAEQGWTPGMDQLDQLDQGDNLGESPDY